MAKVHVKKGDTVRILTGKDRGKKAKVLQVFPALGRVVVEGVNMTVKNVRPKQQGQKGQVVRYNAPIHISNVQRTAAEAAAVTTAKKPVAKAEKATPKTKAS